VFELFGRLPIETDFELDCAASTRFYSLARAHAISAYDAAYLELAGRTGLSLVTLDKGLARAARSAGIAVFSATNR